MFPSPRAKQRIQKVISNAGVMSRRHAEKALKEGRISVNGKTLTQPGFRVSPHHDTIAIDGQTINPSPSKIVVLFHKPRKVVSTKNDPQGRKTVMDFLPKDLLVNPVGRLDYHSEGLLVMTNDGELALKLAHPRFGTRKLYHVEVAGTLTPKILSQLASGIDLEDGIGNFLSIKSIAVQDHKTTLEIEVDEGRNRFIRRMLDACDLQVRRLKRIQVGPYHLGKIPPGEFQILPAVLSAQ